MYSYINKDCAKTLNLSPHSSQKLFIHGFGGHSTCGCYDVTSVNINTSEGIKSINVLITDEIVKPIKQDGWSSCLQYEYIANLPSLANDFKDRHMTIDLLIGCDHAFEFLENKIIKGEGPMVQFSSLGCFISGPLYQESPTHATTATAVDINDNESSPDEITHLESYLRSNILPDTDASDDDHDESFISDFMNKIQFKDGQYFVPLPWRHDHKEIPNNLKASNQRLEQVMRRLRKLNLIDNYVNVMKENIDKGYVSESDSNTNLDEGYYIPHFPVLRDSETTPLRIVFDASSGTPSLNSCLYEGPNLLQDLVRLLLLFRVRKIGLTADIARAFLSVKLLEADRKYVKFLWFKDNDVTKQIVPYQCNTVIFGNVSSPFALAATLKKHLSRYNTSIASDIEEKVYVDNLVTCVDDEEHAFEYYASSRAMMRDASFTLRQWASNSKSMQEVIHRDGSNAKSAVMGVLGVKWDPQSDSLSINKRDLPQTPDLTKRIVTSQTASIFDPLGFVSPMLVPAKIFINKLWKENISWDEKLSPEYLSQWNSIQQSLLKVSEFSFPRWIGGDTTTPLDIIIFCDACPRSAIGCVAYGKQGDTVTLLGSKNKIISKKNEHYTVPKLELVAMNMGAQYGEKLTNTYGDQYKEINVTYVTDSEIALYWLNNNKKLKQFVKNRVDNIKEKTDINAWFHTSTSQNAADILSRGATFSDIENSSWIKGPSWLKDDRDTWPLKSVGNITTDPQVCLMANVELDNEFHPSLSDISKIIDINRFSSYNKLLRVTALVTRAFRKGLSNRCELTASHIQEAEQRWLNQVQHAHYSPVFEYLQQEKDKKRLPKCPPIINQLGLILDDNNILRCGGRLSNATKQIS